MTTAGADQAAKNKQVVADTADVEAARPRSRHLMLYVHVPFCPSKCHFCSWVQGIPKSELLLRPQDTVRRDYIDAVCYEIRERAKEVNRLGYLPNIVYWGGGTASSLEIDEIEKIHTALQESFDLSSVNEATIEGSPDSVTPEKLRFIRSLGYKRFSYGVQSFNDERLRRIGRVHRSEQSREAVKWTVDAGFEDINIDIMCGFPNEKLDEVENTMKEAVKLPVTHVSYYPYRPIEGTVMRKQIAQHSLGTIDVNEQKAAYALGRNILEEAGFHEYAMSYFGHPSLNDLAIFRLKQEWLGFGAGAHSLLNGTWHIHDRGNIAAYIKAPLKWDTSIPPYSEQVVLMLLHQGLSTFNGIERDDWYQQTGKSLDETLQQPGVKWYVNFLRSKIGIIEDEVGIRVPRERTDAFIDILYAMTAVK